MITEEQVRDLDQIIETEEGAWPYFTRTLIRHLIASWRERQEQLVGLRQGYHDLMVKYGGLEEQLAAKHRENLAILEIIDTLKKIERGDEVVIQLFSNAIFKEMERRLAAQAREIGHLQAALRRMEVGDDPAHP